MQPPSGAPVSDLFTVKQSPTAGRGVYASCNIEEGTHVFTADDLNAHVLFRQYRREVCGNCFAYEDGKALSIRDPVHGFVFCSQDCKQQWQQYGELHLEAWTALERLVKSRSKEDIDLVDADAPKPTGQDIKSAWQSVREQAVLVREARAGSSTKQHRKAVQQAISRPVSADIIPLQLSAILLRHQAPGSWVNILALASDPRPYKSAEELRSHVNSYLHLLAILPEPLLEYTTSETVFTILTRDNWNSFGIRSLGDDGSEFFGYGVWPSASYFNHSCGPNLRKQRVGRKWIFSADRDVSKGEELCITYLSGEERALSRNNRMQRLQKAWGFECGCERCAYG